MNDPASTAVRKKEHLELCLNGDVSFKEKTTGFEQYEFKHYAATEILREKISFETDFLNYRIAFPFLISCMTGGTSEAENINAKLAVAANELKIPIGVGSQRQALENSDFHFSYKIIRENAPSVPVLGNLGAAQIVKMKSFDKVQSLVDLIQADAMVIHFNPLQEMLQKNGDTNFKGILRKLNKLTKFLEVPVIVKEVGAGISREAAEKFLSAGIKGIDVAGAGGTSWSAVEILRNKDNKDEFWDWGLPTTFCIKEIYKLKKKYDFVLIGSGGINNAFDMAKAFALGADMSASARIILQKLESSGVEGVVTLIKEWFDTLSKIMFLTGSSDLYEIKNRKLIKKEKLY